MASDSEPKATVDISAAGAGVLVRRFRLTLLDGPDAGQTFTSRGDHAVIGTHLSAQFVLKDKTISRFHCEIQLVDGKPILRDLGSMNGTSVDGVTVMHAVLHSGAVLSLGRSRIRFDLDQQHVEVPVSDAAQFGEMVGRSTTMRAVFNLLERAAATDSTVLLEGETGTGKEAAAEAIHSRSARTKGPFVVVDCGALPSDLLESELFGHEKGAFTGAIAERKGAFEAADGGTIFLDEVGELDASLQPKLLRALEKHEIRRVGSNTYRKVDVRVIAATNRNLRGEVNAKRFRSDLYYRLAVVEARLPPLRERLDDLPILVDHILEHLGVFDRAEAARLRTAELQQELAGHSWPGNVRELRNYLERCVALRDQAPPLDASGESGSALLDASRPLRAVRDGVERWYLAEILNRNGGNVTAAARAAGLDRIHFHRLLRKHGLR
jgi:transcriptional regulator with GAF, ATPase, and Fis domain